MESKILTPNYRQIDWYKRKTAFIHFTVNTFTGNEWGDGTESPEIFNPTELDCEQWIKVLKDAGFTHAIFTAKHHDGFCLWPSKYTDYSVKSSPYKDGKGDIVREFTDACREYGIKAGLYLSPWDRNAPFWGTAQYSKYYAAQLTELLSNYGRIDEVWWDGAGSNETPYDWGMWAYIVRNLQPEAVCFGSMGATPYVEMRWVGNESGFAGDPCFATVDDVVLEVETTALLNSGVPDGNRFIIAEVDVSSRPGWFFHEDQEDRVKTVSQMVHLWFDSVGSNCNLLLNFPPDRTGHLRDKDVNNAIEAHRIVSQALARNFALDAEVTSDTSCYEGYDAVNLLNDFDQSFFAPQGETATVTLKLPKPAKVNMFQVAEVIELGHRVRGFRVEALVDGDWQTLYEGKCIGYKWAKYFTAVESDTFRLVITESKAVPLLRNFGLYFIDESVFADEVAMSKGEDLMKNAGARVIVIDDKTVEVELGGIYPYNTIRFDGRGVWVYTIEGFDGANYHPVFANSNARGYKDQVVHLEETVKTSYKFRLVSTHSISNPEGLEFAVYEL